MRVKPVVPNWPALFFFQPVLDMFAEVLCLMLTSQLFIRGPESPFAYKQLSIKLKKESKRYHWVQNKERRE